MDFTIRSLLWAIFAVGVVSGCSIVRFDVDADYGCGSMPTDTVNDFPDNFVGTHLLTLGVWFKINLPDDNSFIDRFILFMLTPDNTNDEPSVSFISSNGLDVKVYHAFHQEESLTSITLTPGRWYFGIESCDINEIRYNFTIIDPSKSDPTDFIAFTDELWAFGSLPSSPYTSSHKLYFGANDAHSQACTSIWRPFMITDYAVPTESTDYTAVSLAFGIEPLPTYSFTLQPYQVYENLFEYAGDTLILQTQNDPGLLWSTNKGSYPLPDYSNWDPKLSSIPWPHSFINSNGSISFSMRIILKIDPFSPCPDRHHWFVRRFSPDGQLIFGFGVTDDLEALIYFPGSLQSKLFMVFALRLWQEIYLNCQSYFSLPTICTLLPPEITAMAYPTVIIFDNPQYMGKESVNDILLLGSGLSPWENPDDAQDCGSVSILSLTISLGANAFPLDNCFGGCMIKTEGPNSKCYVQDTRDANVTCPSLTAWPSYSKDCIPCPLGCAACTVSDTTTYDVKCTSCLQNFTLLSASGICGCIGSYYFTIDPVTKTAQCIPKQSAAASLSSTSPGDLVFTLSTPPKQANNMLPFLTIYLKGVLLKLDIDYNLTSPADDQITITLIPKANIPMNSILMVDFTTFNQIEGPSVMLTPPNATYKLKEIYYYLDDNTLNFLDKIASYFSMGSVMGLSGTSSFGFLSGGISATAVFLLDALGDLEMYKYLNVNFPKNFFKFYESLYSMSLIPNVYTYLNDGDSVATSEYYKFQEWEEPVLFIEKAGDGFIKENIAFVLAILTWIPFKLCSKSKKLKKIMEAIHYTFRWNMLVSYFIGDFGPFIVQIAIQFREAPFVTSDRYTIFSTSISIIVLLSYVIIFGVGIYQINRKRLQVPEYMEQARKRLRQRIENDKFPESLEVFTEDFKDDSWLDRNFLLITKIEDIILSMNYVLMQERPLAQCYIYTIITGFWLLLVIVTRPLNSRSAFIIFVFNESVKLLLGIIAVVLTSNDSADFLSPEMGLIVGDVMIWTVICALGINALIAVFLLLHSIYEFIKNCCEKYKQKNMALQREQEKREEQEQERQRKRNHKQQQRQRVRGVDESDMSLDPSPSGHTFIISTAKYLDSSQFLILSFFLLVGEPVLINPLFISTVEAQKQQMATRALRNLEELIFKSKLIPKIMTKPNPYLLKNIDEFCF